VLVATAFASLRTEPGKVLLVAFAASLVMLISLAVIGEDSAGNAVHITLAWPWHFPIGTGVTLGMGWGVGRRINR